MSIREQDKKNRVRLGEDNNALTWLIILNAVIFLILNFVKVIYLFGEDGTAASIQAFHKEIYTWFALPANGSSLITRPWTFITYMFSHEDVWYLISTVLWLWCFGFILQDLTGNDKLFPIYFLGGTAGALAFILAANFIPALSHSAPNMTMMGGGASVMAVAVATTTLTPGYRIFPLLNGGIPLWVLTLIFIAIDFGTIASVSGATAIAHLAGGLMGFIFIKQLQQNRNMGLWMHRLAAWINDLFNPEKGQYTKAGKDELFYKTTRKPFQKTPHITQQRVDDLLDKINNQGYNHLTDEEKEFLKKAGNGNL